MTLAAADILNTNDIVHTTMAVSQIMHVHDLSWYPSVITHYGTRLRQSSQGGIVDLDRLFSPPLRFSPTPFHHHGQVKSEPAPPYSARTATAMAPTTPATVLPAPAVAGLVELAAAPVPVAAEVASPEVAAVASAVEEASVAVLVAEPAVLLLALLVDKVVAAAALPVEVDDEAGVEVVVELEAVPEDALDVAVALADDELDDDEEPSVTLNWLCGTKVPY